MKSNICKLISLILLCSSIMVLFIGYTNNKKSDFPTEVVYNITYYNVTDDENTVQNSTNENKKRRSERQTNDYSGVIINIDKQKDINYEVKFGVFSYGGTKYYEAQKLENNNFSFNVPTNFAYLSVRAVSEDGQQSTEWKEVFNLEDKTTDVINITETEWSKLQKKNPEIKFEHIWTPGVDQ